MTKNDLLFKLLENRYYILESELDLYIELIKKYDDVKNISLRKLWVDFIDLNNYNYNLISGILSISVSTYYKINNWFGDDKDDSINILNYYHYTKVNGYKSFLRFVNFIKLILLYIENSNV